MLNKIVEIDRITIDKEGTMQIRESVIFVDGDQIDRCTPTERTLYPGADMTDETDKISGIAAIVWDTPTVARYKEGLQRRSMGMPAKEKDEMIHDNKTHAGMSSLGATIIKMGVK